MSVWRIPLSSPWLFPGSSGPQQRPPRCEWDWQPFQGNIQHLWWISLLCRSVQQLRLVCLGQQGNGVKTEIAFFLCNIFKMFLFKKHPLIPINQISWEALWDLTIHTRIWSWLHRRGPEHCWKFHENAPDVSECKWRAVPEDCIFCLILIWNLTISNRWFDYSLISLESTSSKSGL